MRQVISGLEAQPGCSDLVELLRSLQKDEQAKLRFTLILQVFSLLPNVASNCHGGI